MLSRPVRLSRVEAAIDRAWLLRTALISFGRRGNDIVAHLLPKHPRLPAKRLLVELRHALAVVVGHFEVNDRVHFAHGCPPCRLKGNAYLNGSVLASSPFRLRKWTLQHFARKKCFSKARCPPLAPYVRP